MTENIKNGIGFAGRLSAYLAMLTLGMITAHGDDVFTFSDDFERDDIGPDWSTTGGSWVIDAQNRLVGPGSSSQGHTIYYNGAELTDSWTMSVDVEILFIQDAWRGGFVMNFHEDPETSEWHDYTNRWKFLDDDAETQFLDRSGPFGDMGNEGHYRPATDQQRVFQSSDDGSIIYNFTYSWDTDNPDVISVSIENIQGDAAFEPLTEVMPLSEEGFRDHTGRGVVGFWTLRNVAVHSFTLTGGNPVDPLEPPDPRDGLQSKIGRIVHYPADLSFMMWKGFYGTQADDPGGLRPVAGRVETLEECGAPQSNSGYSRSARPRRLVGKCRIRCGQERPESNKRARDAGVLCVINPDAHWTDGLKDVRYGVEIARKGWLGPEDVVNTKGLEAMQKLLAEWKTG